MELWSRREAVEGAALALEGGDHVHGGDGLPLGVLGVGDGDLDHVLQEDRLVANSRGLGLLGILESGFHQSYYVALHSNQFQRFWSPANKVKGLVINLFSINTLFEKQ